MILTSAPTEMPSTGTPSPATFESIERQQGDRYPHAAVAPERSSGSATRGHLDSPALLPGWN
jgi:hypothetical protein